MDNNRNLQTNLYKNHTKTKFMEENSMKKNNKNKANNKKRIVTSLVDFMCELEAKRKGAEYYVDQREMDYYRPSVEKDEADKLMFFIILMAYDPGCYTKEIHEAVLAEEEAERKLKHNGKNG